MSRIMEILIILGMLLVLVSLKAEIKSFESRLILLEQAKADQEIQVERMFKEIRKKSGTQCTYLPGGVYLKPEWVEEFTAVCEDMGGRVERDRWDTDEWHCICPEFEK